MKPIAALACIALIAGSAGAAERRPPQGNARNSYADPSAVIAAELAFARAAQEKGQWTAFAATAASDAVIFTPQMVLAQGWLRGRANPPVSVKWQPHSVTSSCDGSLMVSQGAWQGPKGNGYFTTIWQRQKDGKYKWIVDSGDALKEPLAAPEMLSARIADCPPRGRRAAAPPRTPDRPAAFDPARRIGQSDDGTLRWGVIVDPSGARNLSIDWTKDGAETPLVIEEVAAPEGK
jgi:hypothetical protein